MGNVQTFGETLDELMRQRGIDAAQLGSWLGGRQNLSRLLRDEASIKRMGEALALLSADLLPPEDIKRLSLAMEVNRLGKADFEIQCALHKLVFHSDMPQYGDIHMENGTSLSAYLCRFGGGEPLNILCVNCLDSGVFSAFRDLLSDPQRRVKVRHYVNVNAESRNPARIFLAVGSTLFDRRYSLYTASNAHYGQDAFLLLPYLLFVQSGGAQAVLSIRADGTARVLSTGRRANVFEAAQRLLSALPSDTTLLTGETAEAMKLDVMLFDRYQREKNRALYMIRPDPDTSLMPPQVQLSLWRDAAFPSVSQRAQHRVESIIRGRYAHFQKRLKPAYFILSPDQTRRFFQTGRQSSQPSCFRACTPSERVEILQSLLSALHANKRLHLRFLKPGHEIHNHQFWGHEGFGVVIRPKGPQGAAIPRELVVRDASFQTQFKGFVLDTLPRGFIYDEPESLALLESMRVEIKI